MFYFLTLFQYQPVYQRYMMYVYNYFQLIFKKQAQQWCMRFISLMGIIKNNEETNNLFNVPLVIFCR